MNEVRAIIKSDGWVICGECGSKLFKIDDKDILIQCKQRSGSKSCKTMNRVVK